ncbi:hypothetical protein RhiirA4_483918 [Rhizophagus irregularis]|uniref:Uncharacterized protein n=1 Tax=Rhizophagus irregularis TaxID=588596 RepID=A0A2I1HN75_9GLOM|nr:hypothetical protein RhiirA4_483918 [Rhizophagus irregularis]
MGEGKNKTKKKNIIDLIKLGIFMKDSIGLILQKTNVNSVLFRWQCIDSSRRMIHSVCLECSATKAEERKVGQATAKIKPSQDNKPLNHDIMRKNQKSLSDHLLQKQAC